NGTWLNDRRLSGRRRLRDGDLVRVGATVIVFCNPSEPSAATLDAEEEESQPRVTPAQRRVLVALCRPFLLTGTPATPSNADLASELFLSIDSVKTHLKALFEAFELGESRSRMKRVELVERAVKRGSVHARDVVSDGD